MKNTIKIKELILSTIITFVMGLLILLTKLSFAYNFIVFIGVECIIGYIYRNRILVKKTFLQNQVAILQLRNKSTDETDSSSKKFNAAYYDLYNSFSFNRTMIMCKAFITGIGKPLHKGSPYKWHKEFTERYGLKFCDIHSLWHFNATVLINAGVDVATISRSLGHSSISTTTNIYCHSFKKAQAKAGLAVAAALNLSPTATN